MGRVWKIISFLTLMTACISDQKLHSVTEVELSGESLPNISVRPVAISFGALNADGESATRTIRIKNVGTDTLRVDDISVDGDGVYSLTAIDDDDGLLEYDEETTFEVTYDPKTYATDVASIYIDSNDPDEQTVVVPLDGVGDAPVIWIDPEVYDFGTTLVGCEETQEIQIWNTGNVDLIVDRIDYFITYPADLGMYDYESDHGPLPWTIGPGDHMTVEIFHNPMDLEKDYGDVEVYSNDPYTPIANAEQTAVGSYASMHEENLEQIEIDEIDILFVLDNSGSMSGNQTQLSNNFDIFMNVFVVSGVDYHIGFVTTDSPAMQGGLIDSSTVDPVGEVQTIISDIGVTGSAHERGIDNAYESLLTGADMGPGGIFWRSDAKLIVIFVSDEDDSSSRTPSDLSSYLVALKGGADYVTAHAVAGDYPGGCATNGGAAEAYDYYTIVNLLSGTFLSICADDWGTPLETLANESILKRTFTLAKHPVEETIYVEVDGVATTEWVYDSATNAISFTEGNIPASGSDIYISYNPVSEC